MPEEKDVDARPDEGGATSTGAKSTDGNATSANAVVTDPDEGGSQDGNTDNADKRRARYLEEQYKRTRKEYADLEAKVKQIEAQRERERIETERLRVASKYKLNDTQAGFLKGSSPEEIEESAKSLVEAFGVVDHQPAPDTVIGRGRAVSTRRNQTNDFDPDDVLAKAYRRGR